MAVHVPAIEYYIYQGCYPSGALSGYSFTNATAMTIEFCVGACKDRNSTYAGVESGEKVCRPITIVVLFVHL